MQRLAQVSSWPEPDHQNVLFTSPVRSLITPVAVTTPHNGSFDILQKQVAPKLAEVLVANIPNPNKIRETNKKQSVTIFLIRGDSSGVRTVSVYRFHGRVCKKKFGDSGGKSPVSLVDTITFLVPTAQSRRYHRCTACRRTSISVRTVSPNCITPRKAPRADLGAVWRKGRDTKRAASQLLACAIGRNAAKHVRIGVPTGRARAGGLCYRGGIFQPADGSDFSISFSADCAINID